MAEHHDRLVEAAGGDLEVVVVTFDAPDRLAAHRGHLGVPHRFVADTERRLYRALGYGRGRRWRVWGWRAGRRYLELLRAGGRPQRLGRDGPGADTLQLGGDVVLGGDGSVRWRFAGAGPDDRPSIDELAEALARAR